MFKTFRGRHPVAAQRDPAPKVPLYRVKGTGLRGERYRFSGREAPVSRAKGTGFQGAREGARSGLRNRPPSERQGRFSSPPHGAETERDRFTGRTGTTLRGGARKGPVYGAQIAPAGTARADRPAKGTGLRGGARKAPFFGVSPRRGSAPLRPAAILGRGR